MDSRIQGIFLAALAAALVGVYLGSTPPPVPIDPLQEDRSGPVREEMPNGIDAFVPLPPTRATPHSAL